jgi:hypothetical protein
MKIKQRLLETLVREIVCETLQRLEEAQRGEWWIYPGGQSQFADGDIGDSGHEAFVIQHVNNELYEHFIGYPPEHIGFLRDWEDTLYDALSSEGRLTEEDMEQWQNDPNSIIKRVILEDKLYKDEKQVDDAMTVAYNSSGGIDPRDYAMKYLRWKRMTSGNSMTSVQTWVLTPQDMEDIRKGVFDAWNDDMDEEVEDSSHTVEIEVRANNKHFSNIPVEVLGKAEVRDIIPYLQKLPWMRENKRKPAPITDPVNFTQMG